MTVCNIVFQIMHKIVETFLQSLLYVGSIIELRSAKTSIDIIVSNAFIYV
jgi:hypothetical protein